MVVEMKLGSMKMVVGMILGMQQELLALNWVPCLHRVQMIQEMQQEMRLGMQPEMQLEMQLGSMKMVVEMMLGMEPVLVPN
jgi:flagellar motor switch/type III secretory pathway protein FliN